MYEIWIELNVLTDVSVFLTLLAKHLIGIMCESPSTFSL